jgi:hypothetical protein
MGTHLASPLGREAIARATGRDARLLVICYRPPISHQANRLYDVWADDERLIAKEYLGDVERNSSLDEYRALQAVQPLDIAPRPVFFDPSVGPVVVYEFLDGEMWDRRVPSAAELEMLADVWVGSRLCRSTGYGSDVDRLRTRRRLSDGSAHPIEHYAASARTAIGSKRHEYASRHWSADWPMACRSSLNWRR